MMGEWWGRARDRRMMGKSKRHATDGGGEWWGRARDKLMMGECKRQASDGVETCRRYTQLMGEANDGEDGEINE